MPSREGVTFIVPVLNGARTLDAALAAILAQDDGRPMQILVVDDGSTDGSLGIIARYVDADPRVRVIGGEHRGAAAAINLALSRASHPIVCQVDQDVILKPAWMNRLAHELDQPGVAAAQGRYVADRQGSIWARVSALDLAQRYDRIRTRFVNHVCTGNSAYRAGALREIGGLDDTLGYGYDNDLSYRLTGAGYRLVFCREARSVHHWRDRFADYMRQQYGLGYGRLDVVARHPAYASGDDVSGPAMMLHAPLALAAIVAAGATALLALAGGPWDRVAPVPILALALPAAERLVAGMAAAVRYRDPAGLLFAPVHLLRDLAWGAAILVWTARRLVGRPARASDSMRRRVTSDVGSEARTPKDARFVAIVPAYNEAASLPAVIDELRRTWPDAGLVVVDDASTDETPVLLERLGADGLRLGQRLGVGGAVRAGLRDARRRGFEVAVRVDGDGQHAASEIERLLQPIREGRADAVSGSRYGDGASGRTPVMRRLIQRVLGWTLSAVSGQRVTDPTSGFWAFGPRAVRFLEVYHPSGYPEPELRLLLSRNRLRVEEVPIHMRDRVGGRTSLTLLRTGHLLARTLLALVVVPLRSPVEVPRHD